MRTCIVASLLVQASANVPACDNGIVCEQLQASGLTFDCRSAKPTGSTKGSVILLHGFPEWAVMYDETMRHLAAAGYESVACDQRGYSPGASPDGVDNYHCDTLRDDVFTVASAKGFDRFHLVGHDHGGALGWHVSTSDAGKQRVLSYSSLSLPHLDAFSKGLYGDAADDQQQAASQYFTMFLEHDSATSHLSLFCHTFKDDRHTSCEEVQRTLYWYNGANAAGVLAIPPIMDSGTLLLKGFAAMSALRTGWGMGNGEVPKEGIPQSHSIGNVEVPALFVCGSSDDALLCNRDYAKATEDYCSAGYQYLEVDCGHDLLACSKQEETDKVILAIVDHITKATAGAIDV